MAEQSTTLTWEKLREAINNCPYSWIKQRASEKFWYTVPADEDEAREQWFFLIAGKFTTAQDETVIPAAYICECNYSCFGPEGCCE